MPSFQFQDQRIAYAQYAGGGTTAAAAGAPPRGHSAPRRPPVLLIHGLLLSQTMHEPLARELAARGHDVITIDLLGHGRSDRPRETRYYSIRAFAEQTLALMDHLQLPQASVMGTSLGANTALEIASLAPDRVSALVVEMPVLDAGLLGGVLTFGPLLAALTLGRPLTALVQHGARLLPRRPLPFYVRVALDALSQDPRPSAAVLQGLFFGKIAPVSAERQALRTPALVIGHHRDPIHPFADAGMLAAEMPNARLVGAHSVLELRLHPQRLTSEVADFLQQLPVGEAPGTRSRAKSRR